MRLFQFMAFAALATTLAACSDTPSQHRTAATPAGATADTAAARQAARDYRVLYNEPISLDSTDFYFQPISVVSQEQESRILSKILYESSGYEDEDSGIEGTCYNVLFFQKSTLEEHALLPHGRFVITGIDVDKKPLARWPYIFYTMIKRDTNADALQGYTDASALFASNRSGRQLRQLTPDGTQLKRYIILPKTMIMLVEVRPDINQDHNFTQADGSFWLRFDLRNLNAAPIRQPEAPLATRLHQQMLDRQSKQTE